MSTLGDFDRSTLGEFTRSPLGERGINAPTPIIIPVTHWLVGGIAFPGEYWQYRKTDIPTEAVQGAPNPAVSRKVFSSGLYSRFRHIRRGYQTAGYNPSGFSNGVFSNNYPLGITNPRIEVPTKIEYFFWFNSVFDSFFSAETLKLYAVSTDANANNTVNYRTWSVLLANIALNLFTPNALNVISLNIPIYEANVVDASWALLPLTSSDADNTDPGLGATHPVVGFDITMKNFTSVGTPALLREFIKFTYT